MFLHVRIHNPSFVSSLMILTYDAIDASGTMKRDQIEAQSESAAVEQLRRDGLFVTSIQHSTPPSISTQLATAASVGRLPLKVLVMFTRQMAMLLRSGSGVVPAIKALKRQMKNPKHIYVLNDLIEELEDGSTLTDAIRRHPKSFDSVYCAIISAGEASGALETMFDRLALIVGKRRAMQKKVIAALTYPALLITMSGNIFLVILLFVLPRFNDMFVQLNIDPPTSTKVLLATGTFLKGYWPAILFVCLASIAGVIGMSMSVKGRQWISDMQTSIPLIGRLRSRLIQGQMFRTMGMLLESRVDIIDTIVLTRGSTNNYRFQKLFDRLEQGVTSGGQLSTAFEQSGLIDPAIAQAIHTGEESGHLGESMTFCADTLDETNDELVTVTMRLIEPLILICMGFFVGGVAISLFMPLFDMTSAIQ